MVLLNSSFIQTRNNSLSKMFKRVIPGILLILLMLIIIACAAPVSSDVSSDLSVKDQAEAPSLKADLTSTSLPANCQVSALAISPMRVNPGEKANVTVYIVNNGNEKTSYMTKLEINKVVAQVIEVDMPAGRAQSVTFQITKDEPGTYELDCGGVTGQLVVINTIIPPKSNTSLLNPPQSNVSSCCPPTGTGQNSTPSFSINSNTPAFSQQPGTSSCCSR
jgi:uncharacterized protein (UPF0333 family)